MNAGKKTLDSRISTKTQTGHRPDIDRTLNLDSDSKTQVVSGRPESKRRKSFIYVETGHHVYKRLRTRLNL